MTQVQVNIEHAVRKCRQKGVRLTQKRQLVLTSLLMSEKAMSAYELVAIIEQEFGQIIPAVSVYRILGFLEEHQLAHKLNLANKYVACRHFNCDHLHDVKQFLICNVCQRVKEISLGKLTEHELKHDVEASGFKLVSPQLELNCVCDDCIHEMA